MNELDKLFAEMTEKQKKTINWKLLLCLGVLVVLIYFLFTFNRVKTQTDELNCITYYTSLGYAPKGCDKYIERFLGES